MKKLFSIFLSGLAIASTTLSFQSCADEYDPAIITKHDQTVLNYTENFIKHYGEIDPNHTWGFGEMPVVNGKAITRAAGAGSVHTNVNQWNETGSDPEQLYGRIHVPGYPNFDGRYYVTEDIRGGITEHNQSNHPAGDVTEYEIQYVSEYFRSHTFEQMRPDMVTLHLTDFFVQNVSADADQDNYPEGNNIDNGITWGMDRLMFKTLDSHDVIDDTWTHVNDFNAGSTVFNPENNAYDPSTNPDGNKYRTIMYITSSGTEDFAYHPSWGTADPGYYDNWVLVRLTWQEIGADGNTYTREGYYLAFDFEAEKEGTKVDPDGYYSNWIIKITPANPKDSEVTKRVMCEDLGNTYDFDFNDVVFDVTFETTGGNTEAIINLQAAGGTMPIYVGKNPTDPKSAVYEAHNLLGNSSSTPVNVGSGARHTIANYRIPVTSTNPENIPIYVVSSGNTANLTSKDTYEIQGPHGPTVKPGNNAPQKFCVPNSVKWMKECRFIEWGYAEFKNWVTQESGNEKWYETITNEEELYTAPAIVQGTMGNGDGSGMDRTDPLAARKTVTLSVNSACTGMGTVMGAGTYIPGKQAKITAVPNSGYRFVKWVNKTTNEVITNNPYTWTMGDSNVEFEAYFEEKPTTILFDETLTENFSNISKDLFAGITLNDGEDLSIIVTMTFDDTVSNEEISGALAGEEFSKEWKKSKNNTSAVVTLTPEAIYNENYRTSANLLSILQQNGFNINVYGNAPTSVNIKCIKK